MNFKLGLYSLLLLLAAGRALAAAPATSLTLENDAQVQTPVPAATMEGGEGEEGNGTLEGRDAAEAAPGQQVNLRQAERVALEQNLSLKAQTYDLLANVAAERKSHGIYDPLFSLVLTEGQVKERPNQVSTILTSSTDYRTYDAGVAQQVFTGGQLRLDFINERDDYANATILNINPSYTSELKLSLVQPLLKNFGQTVTEQGILFAIKDFQRSLQDLRNQAFTVLSSVRDAYYEVLRSRDELAYRQTSLELAQRVLTENQARVKAGVMAPIDILEAEVGVKQRESDLLDAQRQHQDAMDNLALLLNSPEPVQTGADRLQVVPLQTDAEAGYRAALVGRPDIQQQLRDIERLDIEQEVARNQRLPGLDLGASYSHKGLGQNYAADWRDVTSDRYPNWEVGLTFSYPIGNREADNEVLRNKVRRKGLEARLAQLHDQVRTEIRAAIRQLDVNRKKVEVSSRGRELAEEKLRTLLKRKEVGLATTRDVLQGEDDLGLARTTEISSLADYNNAVTEYLRVTGQLLEHEGVYFTDAGNPESDARLLQMQTK